MSDEASDRNPRVLPVAGAPLIRRVLREIWREHRASFVLVLVLFLVAALAGLAPPRLVGLLVDRLSAGAGAGEAALYGVAMLACALVQGALVLVGTRHAYVVGEDVFARLRDDFMRSALELPIGMLERGGTGELLTRTTRDISSVSNMVRKALPESTIALLTVAVTVVAAAVISPLIAPVFILSMPILVPLMRWYLARAQGVYQRMGASFGPIFSSVTETASGARTVEALSLADARARSMEEALSGHWLAAVGRIQLRQVMLPLSNLAFAIPVIAALGWGGWLAVQGTVSIGTVVSVTLLAAALVAPLEALIGWTDELQVGAVSFARILGVTEVRPAAERTATPSSRDVELRDARFSYRTGHEVLHGVDLRVIPGERLAIVGPSGAGKSTIARLLAGIDEPDSGRALLGGVDVTAVPIARRRRELLLVTQESHIFATTIRENVRLADEEADDDELRAALRTTGALAWVEELEDGLDAVVGMKGHPLAGAQEQQLALARVVLADPHTLILDEATSSMDPTAARDLEAALAAALRGRSVIAIAHRLFTAYDADRIAVVEDGRIVELGTHDELVAAAGSYAGLWSAWREDGTTRG